MVALESYDHELVLADLVNAPEKSCFSHFLSVVFVLKNVGERSVSKNLCINIPSCVSSFLLLVKLTTSLLVLTFWITLRNAVFFWLSVWFWFFSFISWFLTDVAERITQSINMSVATWGAALDVSKTCYRIYFPCLLCKFKSFGILDQILKVLSSFLFLFSSIVGSSM